jgi:hypothetical protein
MFLNTKLEVGIFLLHAGAGEHLAVARFWNFE